jgi:hypothetical protein
MAWSVFIRKKYGFPKVRLYLESFVPKHTTAHIQTRCQTLEKKPNELCFKNRWNKI